MKIFLFTGVTVDGKITYKKNSSSKDWILYIDPSLNTVLNKYRNACDGIIDGISDHNAVCIKILF